MYSETREVKYSDLSPHGEASLPAVLRFYQDVAINHSAHSGFSLERLYSDNRAWILLSMNTEILRYPQDREIITVSTFTTAFERCFGYRAFEIRDTDGVLLSNAASFWVFMDIKKGRPMRIYEELPPEYGIEQRETLPYIKHEPEIGDCEAFCEITVGKRDLDTNNHVNNVRLAEFLLEAVPLEERIRKAEIYYKHASYEGDRLTVESRRDGAVTGVKLVGDDAVKACAKFETGEKP